MSPTRAAATMPAQFLRPSRSARAAVDARSGRDTRRLATGALAVAAVPILGQLVHALTLVRYYPPHAHPWFAWLALAAIAAAALVLSRVTSDPMPDWLVGGIVVAIVIPVTLDLVATFGLLDIGLTPTAAVAAANCMIPIAAVRRARVPLVVAGTISTAAVVITLVQAHSAPDHVAVGLANAVIAFLPVLLVVVAVRGLARVSEREVDLRLVQSTIATSRSAVGMHASEELASLDLDAENLLDDVGSGRLEIPLPAVVAERAAAIAARLRVRLIEGRTDTWLRHAVTESAYLERVVHVDDADGLAAELTAHQRECLLLGLWLVTGSETVPEPQHRITVVCSRSGDAFDDESGEITVEVVISPMRRHQIDAAAWEAFASLGRNEVAIDGERIRIAVHCIVDDDYSENCQTQILPDAGRPTRREQNERHKRGDPRGDR